MWLPSMTCVIAMYVYTEKKKIKLSVYCWEKGIKNAYLISIFSLCIFQLFLLYFIFWEKKNLLACLLHNSGQHKFGRFIVNYNMTVVSFCFGRPNKFTNQQASMSEKQRYKKNQKKMKNDKLYDWCMWLNVLGGEYNSQTELSAAITILFINNNLKHPICVN